LPVWSKKGAEFSPFAVLHEVQNAPVLSPYHISVKVFGVGTDVPLASTQVLLPRWEEEVL
jgi:hypothetical protein